MLHSVTCDMRCHRKTLTLTYLHSKSAGLHKDGDKGNPIGNPREWGLGQTVVRRVGIQLVLYIAAAVQVCEALVNLCFIICQVLIVNMYCCVGLCC